MQDSAIAIIDEDGWLEPYREEISARRQRFLEESAALGDLREFASAHQQLGIQRVDGGWVYREWAPRATALSLIGDFNDWDRAAHPMQRTEDGAYWEVSVSDADGLAHGGRYKVHIVGESGAQDRIPAYAQRVVQDPQTHDFSAELWAPEQPFTWSADAFKPKTDASLLIYEAHVGMSGEAESVASYRDFAENVLPRIARLGYTAVQLMAVAEHPYYGSFGYHVANFFAASSRCGTPDDLKYLVNTAHGLGVAVIMDVVHSHAVKNVAEGLAAFDGADGLYFKGEHPQWDSLLFDYASTDVRRFLLSNLRYWLEEFRFDGFRFDGVTSMLYHNHGDTAFDHYDKYFKDDVDAEAVLYLQLASQLVREINSDALLIAEDFSGMPGLCRAQQDGGLGFDYRLGMGVPDHWIKLLKHVRDEDWDLAALWNALCDRRAGERTVTYAESHDQALVGDKTIAFWLMDKEMYDHMRTDDAHPVIERGIALHKMIRLLTASTGGEAYLNFMGNEFGHPEWVDFPREGNDWSYQYARRQWSLADHPELRYGQLQAFEQGMLAFLQESGLLNAAPAQQLNLDTENQCLMFERANHIFAFNFHPERSIPDYRFPVPTEGEFTLVLDSDAPQFGGFGRNEAGVRTQTIDGELSIYLPARSALVFAKAAKS